MGWDVKRILVVAAMVGMTLAPGQAPVMGVAVGWERPQKVQSWFDPGFVDLAVPRPGVAIAVDGSTVHLVWSRYAAGKLKLLHMASHDRGETWSDRVRLASTRTTDYRLGSMYPAVDVKGDEVHVTWLGFNVTRDQAFVFHRASHDAGRAWGPKSKIGSAHSWHPVGVTIDGRHVHVVFNRVNNAGGSFAAHAVSHDRGATWTPPVRISRFAERVHRPVVIDASAGRVHVVYREHLDLHVDALFYRRSDDHGRTWTVRQRVSDRTSEHNGFDISSSQNHVHVAYGTFSGPAGEGGLLQYRTSADGGETWAKATTLMPIGDSPVTALAADGKFVHLLTAWLPDEAPKAMVSPDAGHSWSDPEDLRGHQSRPYEIALGADRVRAHAAFLSPKPSDEWTSILRYQRRN